MSFAAIAASCGGRVDDLGAGGAPRVVPDADTSPSLPAGNEYGGPGGARCASGYGIAVVEPACTSFFNCARSCFVESDCPDGSGGGSQGARPVCVIAAGAAVGTCHLLCGDARTCPDGMECVSVDGDAEECYWPVSISADCSGDVGYACTGGGCAPELICIDGFCMPPGWVNPRTNAIPETDCGMPAAERCSAGATQAFPVGVCTLDLGGLTSYWDGTGFNLEIDLHAFGTASSEPLALTRVGNAESCAGVRGAWYPDPAGSPKVYLCPATCDCSRRFASAIAVGVCP